MRFTTLILGLVFSTLAQAQIKSYFNHNSESSYREPYRSITRSGDNLEQVVITEINKARKSVYVAVQELRLPLIATALINKKKQGVDVRIVLEHDYNFTVDAQSDTSEENEHDATRSADLRAFVDVNKNGKFETEELETRDAIYMLRKAQIPIMDDTFDGTKGSGLMHHKFVIVDGKTSVVSTANFTMSCIHGDTLTPATRGNANSIVVLNSVDAANVFTREFSQLWGNGVRGNYGQNKAYTGRSVVNVGGSRVTIQFSPTNRKFSWYESTNGLIGAHLSHAKQSVNAALFVYSDQFLGNILEVSQHNGAKMGFLVEQKFAWREYSELLDMLGLRMLSRNCKFEGDNNPWTKPATEVGVPSLFGGDVLHHKFAVIDGKTTIMGSQNWSEAANYTNDETLIVVENTSISDTYTREYNRLRGISVMGLPSRIENAVTQRERECANMGIHY